MIGFAALMLQYIVLHLLLVSTHEFIENSDQDTNSSIIIEQEMDRGFFTRNHEQARTTRLKTRLVAFFVAHIHCLTP
jgi:hypothetical protein